jgi:16S rRNA (guanine966-N2)-methyltransferase
MRVIAGRYKGRKLEAPPGRDVRPTSDMVREAVFSMLASLMATGGDAPLAGKSCLDLFAGTGALGVEALSRGAESCVFVEVNPVAAQTLAGNVDRIAGGGLARGERAPDARIIRSDWRLALRRLRGRVDVVFVDPPYRSGYCDEVMKTLLDCDIISDGGFVAIERASPGKNYRGGPGRKARGGKTGMIITEKETRAGGYEGFESVRERRYGRTLVEVYVRA